MAVDSRFSFSILYSLYSRPAVRILCVPFLAGLFSLIFPLIGQFLNVSERGKADLRTGREKNLSRQKDSEISTFQWILQSQNAFTPRIPYSRLKLLVIVNARLIGQESSAVNEQVGIAAYSAFDGHI